MKSDDTFINSFCGAQPPIPILTRSLHVGGDSSVYVCVFADELVAFQCVFMLMFEKGGGGISRDKR